MLNAVTPKESLENPVSDNAPLQHVVATNASHDGKQSSDVPATPDLGEWFSDDPPNGSKFAFGPLEGPLKSLAKWIGIDPRTLSKHNGKSVCWIKKIHGKKFAVWFSSQQKLAEANHKRLADNTQKRTK